MTLVTLSDVRQARTVVAPYVHHTPIFSASTLGQMLGIELYFKAELFQKTGSFKVRGALNKVNSLTPDEKARGVIAISAGNHAAGLAYAASVMGTQARIVMPESAVKAKVEATRSYGGIPVLHGDMKGLMTRARELQVEHQLTFVHPFDDPYIIAGQGTVGLEILEDLPDVDVVLAPIGGGGLASGVAAVVKALRPSARVIGVEPVGAAAMHASLQAQRPVTLEQIQTVADGLAAPFGGEHTLAHIKALVDEVVLVTDADIIEAMFMVMERSKLFVEPAAAAGFAALLAHKAAVQPGERVVCILSGGNVDRERVKQILNTP